jgi:hypothetical protein
MDGDVGNVVREWLTGTDRDRLYALFLLSALQTGAIATVRSAASDPDSTVAVGRPGNDSRLGPPPGRTTALVALERNANTVDVRFDDSLRVRASALDSALRTVIDANAEFFVDRGAVTAEESSTDWHCALNCTACTLFDVGCDPCQECSGIPPGV